MAKLPTHSKGEGLISLSDIDASDRLRELTPDVMKYIEESLAPSIAEHGLIQPVVLDSEKRLVAGGCRYTAFKLLQYEKIPYVTRSKLSASDAVLLELEENLRRKQMRWQEITLGIYSAHKKKKTEASRVQAKWGVRQTGALLGQSHAAVADALVVAERLIAGDTEVLEAPTFEKAWQVLLNRKQEEAMKALAKKSGQPIIFSTAARASGPVTEESEPTSAVLSGQLPGQNKQVVKPEISGAAQEQVAIIDLKDIVVHTDCHSWFAAQAPETIDHIFTDIPYGIDMDNIDDLEGLEVTKDEHDVEENISQMKPFLEGAWKVLREHAYCCFYYAPEHHNYLQDLAKEIGFGVQPWPNLWIKSHGIKNKHPHRTFGKSFDPIMVLWKGQPNLRKAHNRCEYTADGMMEKRMQKHPFAKPFEVNKWMLEAIAFPGQTILDPYAGCGSIARCGISLGMRVISLEKKARHIPHLQETYVTTYRNMLGEKTQFVGGMK